MDFTLWTKTPIRLDKIPIKAKINTLNSSNLAAVEPLNNFLFCFSGPFSSVGNRSTFMEDPYQNSAIKSTNFEYKSLIHVNGRTHITPYISNIGTTKILSDLQFCRYNWTILRVVSTKYEVAMSNFAIFMPENVCMY